jgi:prepilin-type N-terminal cleavage/methylation domain-containing protein
MKTRRAENRSKAFTLLELLLVILVLVILAAIFLPSPGPSNIKAKRINCVNNLKEIGLAMKVWEGDHDDKYPMETSVTNGGTMELANGKNLWRNFVVMSNELSTPKLLVCPADSAHKAATNFASLNNANISYFLNLDASDIAPQMILSGDDNFLVNGKPVQPGLLNLWTNTSVAWSKDRHHFVGNIGLADGSVQEVTANGLASAISNAAAPSRLVIP